MEKPNHQLSDLFSQLGLPADAASIEAFVASHRPLADGVVLADAPFWSVSQAQLLRQKLADDSDWVGLVDTLNAMLSA